MFTLSRGVFFVLDASIATGAIQGEMVMKFACLVLALVLCSSASAQDVIQSELWSPRRDSRFTYGRYNVGGENVAVTHHRVGRFTYGYHSDGSSSTTTRIGSRVYTNIVMPMRSACLGGKCR